MTAIDLTRLHNRRGHPLQAGGADVKDLLQANAADLALVHLGENDDDRLLDGPAAAHAWLSPTNVSLIDLDLSSELIG